MLLPFSLSCIDLQQNHKFYASTKVPGTWSLWHHSSSQNCSYKMPFISVQTRLNQFPLQKYPKLRKLGRIQCAINELLIILFVINWMKWYQKLWNIPQSHSIDEWLRTDGKFWIVSCVGRSVSIVSLGQKNTLLFVFTSFLYRVFCLCVATLVGSAVYLYFFFVFIVCARMCSWMCMWCMSWCSEYNNKTFRAIGVIVRLNVVVVQRSQTIQSHSPIWM